MSFEDLVYAEIRRVGRWRHRVTVVDERPTPGPVLPRPFLTGREYGPWTVPGRRLAKLLARWYLRRHLRRTARTAQPPTRIVAVSKGPDGQEVTW